MRYIAAKHTTREGTVSYCIIDQRTRTILYHFYESNHPTLLAAKLAAEDHAGDLNRKERINKGA